MTYREELEARGHPVIPQADIITDTEDDFGYWDKQGQMVHWSRVTEVFWRNVPHDELEQFTHDQLDKHAKSLQQKGS